MTIKKRLWTRRLLAGGIGLALSGVAPIAVSADEPLAPGTPTTYATSDTQLAGGLAVGPDGTAYVSTYTNDANSHGLRIIDGTGTVTSSTWFGVDGTYWPHWGVELDSQGNIYVVDVGRGEIRTGPALDDLSVLDTNGDPDNSAHNLNDPDDIAVDAAGNIYIADSYNHRVQKIDPQGNVTTVLGVSGVSGQSENHLNAPAGVFVDTAGNVYVADTSNHRVQKVDLEGNVTTVAGTVGVSGQSQDHLKHPYDVALDSVGNLYIADASNNRVQKADLEGNVTTFVGNSDGTSGSSATELNYATDVVVDGDDNLYTLDRNNSRIQKVVLDNVDPTVNVSGATGRRVGDGAKAQFECADEGYGIDTCAATLDGTAIDNGDLLAVGSRGTHTLVVTATDLAGNTTTNTQTFVVAGGRELTGGYAGVEGSSGSIARLYMATFTRNPEGDGFGYWEGRFDDGMTLQEMADFFATSAEFQALYGVTTNSEFVELMYVNVMNRPSDPGGHAFWLSMLEDEMTQTRMLLMLSDSPEFKGLTRTS